MRRIAIIGPAYPLRGGLATFNQRLAEQLQAEGDQCVLISFSLQYPKLLFPGKTQYSDDAPPKALVIRSVINSINPVNWLKTGRWLKSQNFDLIIVRYWIPFMSPALGTILRIAKKNRATKIICIADNVTPHEHRPGDKTLSRYFLSVPHAFITMSTKVLADLRVFERNKPAIVVQHPLYDNFGNKVNKNEAKRFLGIAEQEKVILFFGFIRKYKGLDLLIEAMKDSRVKASGIRLLVAGEFYEDERFYKDLIKNCGVEESIILQNHFIADENVKYYLCAADAVIQPYRNATQSGVTPLAYHFETPMIVTNVGGLPALVPHKKVGIVCQANPLSIANAILDFYQLGEEYFIPHLRKEKQKYSWDHLTAAIKDLAHN